LIVGVLGRSWLMHGTEAEIRHPPRLPQAESLQPYRLAAGPREQPQPVAEQDGHQVDEQLVDEPVFDALPADAGAKQDEVFPSAAAGAVSTAARMGRTGR